MIALVKHRDGTMCIAEQQSVGKLQVWKTSGDTIWLESWVQVLEELESLDNARQVYPEYFV